MEIAVGFSLNQELKKLFVNSLQFVMTLMVKHQMNVKLGEKIVILMASNVFQNKNAQIIFPRLLVVILVQMVFVFGKHLTI